MAILRNAFHCPRAMPLSNQAWRVYGTWCVRAGEPRREMTYYGAEITVPIPGPAMYTRNVVRDMVSSHICVPETSDDYST